MATRNTEQRAIVIAALQSLANHPTAEEVYAAIHQAHPSISKATVYRTLNRLADEGVALRVRINNGADRFDHQVFSHYHVRCTVCGSVDDVPLPMLQDLEIQAQALSSYRITGHSLQFDGVCPACQDAQSSKEQE